MLGVVLYIRDSYSILHLVDEVVLRREVGVTLALHRLVEALLGDVLDLEDAIALLHGLAFKKGVNFVSALVVGRLDVLWLYLQPGLAHHSRTLNVSLSDSQV